MAETRAQLNRAVRQEALREQLAGKGLVQKVLVDIGEIDDLDIEEDHFKNHMDKLSLAIDKRMKLINKYLPDLKATELTGVDGEPLTISVVDYAKSISTK